MIMTMMSSDSESICYKTPIGCVTSFPILLCHCNHAAVDHDDHGAAADDDDNIFQQSCHNKYWVAWY